MQIIFRQGNGVGIIGIPNNMPINDTVSFQNDTVRTANAETIFQAIHI